MCLYIIEEDLIQCVERNFRDVYPHLRLQFYRKPRKKGLASTAGEQLSSKLAIEEIAMFHTSGKINIDPDRTVAAVEHDFFRNLGLCVQVFRQSGNVWLETTNSDDWTLQQQEQKAAESLWPYTLQETEGFDLCNVG